MTKNFTIINDELYAVKNAGYKLDFENDITHSDFSKWRDPFGNRASSAIDSFYDLDNAKLCRDENGELYAVEYLYSDITHDDLGTLMPMIWQKVVQ